RGPGLEVRPCAKSEDEGCAKRAALLQLTRRERPGRDARLCLRAGGGRHACREHVLLRSRRSRCRRPGLSVRRAQSAFLERPCPLSYKLGPKGGSGRTVETSADRRARS